MGLARSVGVEYRLARSAMFSCLMTMYYMSVLCSINVRADLYSTSGLSNTVHIYENLVGDLR